jgi:hypothetical protein
MKFSILAILCTALLSLFACDGDDENRKPDFDRAALLAHYADHLIVPAYQGLQVEAGNLQVAWQSFAAEPTAERLQELQAAWGKTAIAWQSANAFNFGPAGEEGLRRGLVEEIGAWPVDVQTVDAAIAAGSAQLPNAERDARGIYTMEYLIFGENADTAALLASLQDPHRQAYLTAVLNDLVLRVGNVLSGWQSFRSSFVEDDGTSAGSSTSSLYNEFVRSFEAIKNFKVGLPAGKRASQTGPEPQLVEARYSGQSLPLMEHHLAAIYRIYKGWGLNGEDGPGFVQYLQAVPGGEELVTATEAQWEQVLNAYGMVPKDLPLEARIGSDGDPLVDQLHTELQKHIRFFKSDMSSLLGIAITFSSSDGD